ncbi:hypothetical protein [Streptomyces sp. 4N124]|uniref:hypothetical protein n=1 Tax=Streptomyces sp. 4N124 TaxID=3457420 RepID=UPI003FD31CF5
MAIEELRQAPHRSKIHDAAMNPVIAAELRLLHETAPLEELMEGVLHHQSQQAVEANCAICPSEPH